MRRPGQLSDKPVFADMADRAAITPEKTLLEFLCSRKHES